LPPLINFILPAFSKKSNFVQNQGKLKNRGPSSANILTFQQSNIITFELANPVRHLRQDFLLENLIIAKQVEVALLGKVDKKII